MIAVPQQMRLDHSGVLTREISDPATGIRSDGPYRWLPPRDLYSFVGSFKTEIGSPSIPTIESIQGMMPRKDWKQIDDDWARHGLAHGPQQGDKYPATLEQRYGRISNLADFVRKAQLANYEEYRAIFEARDAKLFNPATGVILWMSNPAQPSFVWQLYHHDLEPNSSLFAVEKSGEMVHIQLNELTHTVMVINNRPTAIRSARATATLYYLDGTKAFSHEATVDSHAKSTTSLGPLIGSWHKPALSTVYFVKLDLADSQGQILSTNFYWQGFPTQPDNLQALNELKTVNLEANARRSDKAGKLLITLTLHNPASQVALMTHVQLRRTNGNAPPAAEPSIPKDGSVVNADPLSNVVERVLPVYYSDNYISLVPGESRTITIEADLAELKDQEPQIVLDGWNIGVANSGKSNVQVISNINAQVDHWPVTGLPIVAHTWQQ